MHKDVIYIESEDDITDILAKLTAAEEKIVALVPPKKTGVLRSAVNVKLIAKSARAADKVAVLITADPTLIRLCASARVPVAKTLQSRPEIPELSDAADNSNEQVIEEDLSDKDEKKPAPEQSEKTAPKKPEPKDEDAPKPSKKDSKNKKDKSKQVPDIKRHRKYIIAGIIAAIAIIGFLVWALVFAPAVKIAISVQTTANNFAESVTITTGEVTDPENGTLAGSEKKIEDSSEIEFTATGQKDLGNKASGTLELSHTFKAGESSITIPAGTTFTQSGLSYVTTSQVTIDAPGKCNNDGENCKQTTTVAISAAETGEKYNIGAHDTGWSSYKGVFAKNTGSISGGSTNIVTVVQQSDVDAASANLTTASETEGKEKLYKEVGDDNIAIDSTYAVSSSNITSTPAVGEEVKSGVTPKLSSTTTYTVFVVDKADVEKFISAKVTLADDQKIYSFGDPYFERFAAASNGTYSARLKTSYRTGPKVSNDEVLEKVKGKKTGEVQSLLKSINGVSNVDIETSFFWVTSVPDDPNKITIEITNESEQEDAE